MKNVFAKDSAILTGGGLKGFVLPENYMDVIQEFLGVDRIQEGYGMSEISAFHWACDEKHYHVQPWVIPFLLDPDTSEPLPREGVRDRPRRVLRLPEQQPLGRRHLGRRDHDRLEHAVPLRPRERAHRTTRSCATARSRASRTTGSAARPPRRCKTEALRFMQGIEG